MHVGPEGLPDARELHADDAAAEDDDLAGHEVQVQCLVGGHDAAADLQSGEGAREGAGGEHDVTTGVLGAVHLDGRR